MNEYGYRDKQSIFIYGPENFEIDSAPECLIPIYLQPQFDGQKPFACTMKDVGIFFYHIESVKKYKGEGKMIPLYEGVKL